MKIKIQTLFFFLFLLTEYSYGQENILERHKSLIKNLSEFEWVAQLDTKLIKYQKKGARTNYGFGVASRERGKIIYPADDEISFNIHSYGKYIAIPRLNKLGKRVYGLIDSSGEIILDFKYDKIGSVLMPLPDSMIIVQMDHKFGVFNTVKGELSPLKYNNTNNALNDGYAYHDGGSETPKKIIYGQLGIEGYAPNIIPVTDYQITTVVSVTDSGSFLMNNKRKKLSKNYDIDLRPLVTSGAKIFYLGISRDASSKNSYARKIYLVDGGGVELAELSSDILNRSPYFVELDRERRFFFTENNKIVEIPDGYEFHIRDYAKEGFLGFKNRKTGDKLFVDKYGNKIIFEALVEKKPAYIAPMLNDSEISAFQKLGTTNNPLGRVTKYNYGADGNLKSETTYEFTVSGRPEFAWQDQYYYNSTGKLDRTSRTFPDGLPFKISRVNDDKKLKNFNAKNQLMKIFFQNGDYTYEERMTYNSKGQMDTKTTLTFGKEDGVSKYTYNANGLVVKETKFKDKKPGYTYETSYDSKKRKIGFDMIDERGVLTGAWLYQYNSANQLLYQIDLYGKVEEKTPTLVESPPPPPPPKMPNTKN